MVRVHRADLMWPFERGQQRLTQVPDRRLVGAALPGEGADSRRALLVRDLVERRARNVKMQHVERTFEVRRGLLLEVDDAGRPGAVTAAVDGAARDEQLALRRVPKLKKNRECRLGRQSGRESVPRHVAPNARDRQLGFPERAGDEMRGVIRAEVLRETITIGSG